MNKETRRYSMERRSAQAEATRERVRKASIEIYCQQPQDFTLKAVAERAQTSVQTVLRIFGNKDALMASVAETARLQMRRQNWPDGDAIAAVRVLFDDYEKSGDLLIQQLGAERLYPSLSQQIEAGRHSHREWVEKVFAAQLRARTGQARQTLLFGLLAASDVSVWKLLRRDFGLYRRAAEMVVIEMITGLLRERQA